MKFIVLSVILSTLISLLFCKHLAASGLSEFELDQKLNDAFVRIDGDYLVAHTGRIERRWKWTGNGLLTTNLLQLSSGKEWVSKAPSYASDWQYLDLTEGNSELLKIESHISTDNGFTSEHIELIAEVKYAKINVQFIVWVYPNSDGLRTQLRIKKHGTLNDYGRAYDFTPKKHLNHNEYAEFVANSDVITGRTEYLPIDINKVELAAIGYYNHTQGRNALQTQILRDVPVEKGTIGWASILYANSSNGGLIMVKESHKTVNQAGLNTGVFHTGKKGVFSSGWGVLPQDLTENYEGLWANWIVLHDGKSAEQAQLALKQFDRVRYPVDPKRDIYIMANTWGSGETKNWSQAAAREENVISEIDSQVDLGLDLQQVDDGWQGWATSGDNWRPVPVLDYTTRPIRKKVGMGDGEEYDTSANKYLMYPEGWKNIKEYAKEKSLRLGLWAHARVPLDDLKWNYNEGGFTSYKIDFLNFTNYKNLRDMLGKIRQFALYTDHKIRVNWDVTEHPPRIGYFFGREYGNVYLANRKTKSPREVVYRPYLVLRDAWQLAKYVNLNKFQITVQNGDRVNPKFSDADQHDHDYLVAQTLMGSPIFFQETHYYSQQARDQIKPLISAYKSVRQDMYKGFVFPIGDLPDNKSWSGFQNHNPNTGDGYITIFRQLENTQQQQSIELNFIQGKRIELTNLMTQDRRTLNLDKDGQIVFNIPQAGGFQLLKYTLKQ